MITRRVITAPTLNGDAQAAVLTTAGDGTLYVNWEFDGPDVVSAIRYILVCVDCDHVSHTIEDAWNHGEELSTDVEPHGGWDAYRVPADGGDPQ